MHGAQKTQAGVYTGRGVHGPTGTGTDARIQRKVTGWVCRGRGHMCGQVTAISLGSGSGYCCLCTWGSAGR